MKLRPGYTSIRQFGNVVAAPPGFPVSGVPTLSNFSALGASPLVLQWSTTDYVAGYRAQLQIATNSSFATITQNIIFFIDGASWALDDMAIGLATPSGTYYARIRELRDNESGTTVTGNDPLNNALSFNADVSAWSNTFTDTITASVAALVSINGTGKNANITVSGSPPLTAGPGIGGQGVQNVRTTVAQASDYAQWEFTITALTTDQLHIGFEDGTGDFSNAGTRPGVSNASGIEVQIWNAAGTIHTFYNLANNGDLITTEVNPAQVGDVFTLRLKKSTNKLEIWRTRSSVTTLLTIIGGATVGALSAYYAYVGVVDTYTGTCNFGGSTYSKAADAGCALLWA